MFLSSIVFATYSLQLRSQRPRRGDLSFAKLREKHIMSNFARMFSDIDCFIDGAAVLQALGDFQCVDEFKAMFEERADLDSLHAGNASVMLKNMRELTRVITFYQDTHSAFLLKFALLEVRNSRICLIG